MADLAITPGTDALLKELTAKIKSGQQPQIQTMSGWMSSWGMSIPAVGKAHGMGSMAPSVTG